MLHAELAAIDAEPLDHGGPWLFPSIAGAGLASLALIAWVVGSPLVAGVLAVAALGAMAGLWVLAQRSAVPPIVAEPLSGGPSADFALVGAALSMVGDPAAITDGMGTLLSANGPWRERFGPTPPRGIGRDDHAREGIELARTLAWRDGSGCAANIDTASGSIAVETERVGVNGDQLIWRVPTRPSLDPMSRAVSQISGTLGEQLASAGVMAALADDQGKLRAANAPFSVRCKPADGANLEELLVPLEGGSVRLANEGDGGQNLHAIHVPLDPSGEGRAGTFLLFPAPEAANVASTGNVQALLDVLPIGLALVNRDGRFITMNKAFQVAGGIGERPPSFPGDLVVKEDKAAVADAVRRNARGPAMSGDLAVRLNHLPGEPVALTIAGLRGLGEAVVLLLLKDNSEEAKLKRQIAQATKMQAVGQLAGGVAHDFNNILTAIIGHCDLMLMRHTPGDSDYDDIQQIKSNSNRAAGLTRQLLAFSRQQTLRPQVLQLPDVVSEVSHLLKRLLGETVVLNVKHGRDLGSVRADPGQLEQVIVNLAVNARDAMAGTGGGTLTIQTYPVRADQVAELGSEILPIADYSALSISDTGCGIPPNVLGKVFEPFFTTKEVGKGTGLGLSTVYGIVKQSGGFIFAESKVGEGTSFVIYLPVHREEKSSRREAPVEKVKQEELWGTGTVLLVEDEPMVRTVAERALTRQGYRVVTANNGEEALEILDKGDEFALLISDVVMPAMDGPTMVREARKSRPDLKVLFMSGYAEEQLRKSIDIANVAFLPKPFSVQELAEAARRTLAAK
ncbi:response regulator [Sphingomonas ginkgonis]|uniref:histidine kinase n=1 Tax=Sphingomonas ginkgonis TaxID=2315330 RepID=A0A3R9YIT0_9SPHN|nr:response regulator [Sphingomonas ginkgonis]RST30821.1 response regulator [Sphingomonas ginkgonis]